MVWRCTKKDSKMTCVPLCVCIFLTKFFIYGKGNCFWKYLYLWWFKMQHRGKLLSLEIKSAAFLVMNCNYQKQTQPEMFSMGIYQNFQLLFSAGVFGAACVCWSSMLHLGCTAKIFCEGVYYKRLPEIFLNFKKCFGKISVLEYVL